MTHCIDWKIFWSFVNGPIKGFCCLPHKLLLAKLNTYGFSLSALRLICSYLFSRQQRTKINASYSSWEEILFGVPQGSILGPLLFDIFKCDLFIILVEIDFTSYADDKTPFIWSVKSVNLMNMNSTEDVFLVIFWNFLNNYCIVYLWIDN